MLCRTALFAGWIGLATAHGVIQNMVMNGKTYNGPGPAEESDPALDTSPIRQVYANGPVTDITSEDMACGLKSKGEHTSTVAEVSAGSDVSFKLGPDAWPHDVGPVTAYMGKCPSTADKCEGVDLQWFKIDAKGYYADNNTWYQQDTIYKGQPGIVTIPAGLEEGDYLLRTEILALHRAQTTGGAEFFIQCTQIHVIDGGSAKPSSSQLVKFPGAYDANDPGILVDVYTNFKSYSYPGPAPFTGGSSVSADPTSDTSTMPVGSTVTSIPAETSTDMPTTTDASATAEVPTSTDASSTLNPGGVHAPGPVAPQQPETSSPILILNPGGGENPTATSNDPATTPAPTSSNPAPSSSDDPAPTSTEDGCDDGSGESTSTPAPTSSSEPAPTSTGSPVPTSTEEGCGDDTGEPTSMPATTTMSTMSNQPPSTPAPTSSNDGSAPTSTPSTGCKRRRGLGKRGKKSRKNKGKGKKNGDRERGGDRRYKRLKSAGEKRWGVPTNTDDSATPLSRQRREHAARLAWQAKRNVEARMPRPHAAKRAWQQRQASANMNAKRNITSSVFARDGRRTRPSAHRRRSPLKSVVSRPSEHGGVPMVHGREDKPWWKFW